MKQSRALKGRKRLVATMSFYVVCSQPVDNKLIVSLECVAREYMSDIYRHGFGVICSVDSVRNTFGNAQYATDLDSASGFIIGK